MVQALPTRLGWTLVITFAIVSVLTTITTLLRVYVRTKLLRQFGTAEDWAAGAGYILTIVYYGTLMTGPFFGAGQHILLMPFSTIPNFLKLWWLNGVIYYLANMTVKLSISLMLLRFVVEEYQRKLVLIVGVILQVYSLAYVFVFMFQCRPLSFFWTSAQGDTDGKCIPLDVLFGTGYAYVAVTILYDVSMAILPWFMVRNMQLTLRTRIMVAGVLAMGSIASIASLVRVPFIIDLERTKDITYHAIGPAITSGFELGLSLIASSAATLKPLFRKKNSDKAAARPPTPRLATISPGSNATSSTGGTMVDNFEVSADQWKDGS